MTATELTIEPGQALVLYTDGLVEQRGRDLDAGIERLCSLLTAPLGEDLKSAFDRLLTALRPDGGYEDDVAVLVVRAPSGGATPWSRPWSCPGDRPRRLARAFAARILASWDLRHRTELVTLLVSELVTNAIGHSDGPIGLRRTQRVLCVGVRRRHPPAAPATRRPRTRPAGGCTWWTGSRTAGACARSRTARSSGARSPRTPPADRPSGSRPSGSRRAPPAAPAGADGEHHPAGPLPVRMDVERDAARAGQEQAAVELGARVVRLDRPERLVGPGVARPERDGLLADAGVGGGHVPAPRVVAEGDLAPLGRGHADRDRRAPVDHDEELLWQERPVRRPELARGRPPAVGGGVVEHQRPGDGAELAPVGAQLAVHAGVAATLHPPRRVDPAGAAGPGGRRRRSGRRL